MKHLALLIVLLVAVATASAGIINVPGDKSIIQEAINIAVSGDTVMVAAGTFTGPLSITNKSIALLAPAGPLLTTITGSGDLIVFIGSPSSGSIISGFRIQGGNKAIWCQNSGPTITHCLLIGQQVTDWAAIVLSGVGYGTYGPSPARIINNTILNSANGAISSFSSQAPLIENNIIMGARYGIHVDDNFTATLSYNDVYGNGGANYVGHATAGTGSISTDPLLLPTYKLANNSPCIDTGDPDPQFNDPDGSRSDMGAVAYVPPGPFSLRIANEDTSHVAGLTPTFAWSYYKAGTSQIAYRVEVGSDTDWTVAEQWNSGTISSSDTSALYDGAPLARGNSYFVRVSTNDGTAWTLWKTLFFHMDTAPSIPVLQFPGAGTVISSAAVYLRVKNSTDIEKDGLTYFFELYADAGLTSLVSAQSGLFAQPDSTASARFSSVTANTPYWWRVRSFDGFLYSDWSVTGNFTTRTPVVVHVPSEYATIQDAVNAVGTGDSVIVAPGNYSTNLLFSGKGVAVVSSDGPDVTVLRPEFPTLPIVRFVSHEPKGAALKGFTLTGGQAGAILCVSSSPTILGNHIVANSSTVINTSGGITFRNTSFSLIAGNIFAYDTSQFGPAMHLGDDGTTSYNDSVSYNIVYSNRGTGAIRGLGAQYNMAIFNNTIGNANYVGILLSTSGSQRVRNNIITSVANGEAVLGSEANNTAVCSYNCLNGNYGNFYSVTLGSGNIYGNPLYLESANGDFHLTPTSPCINAGDPYSIYNDSDGTRNDIGALSYAPPYAGRINIANQPLKRLIDLVPTFNWSFFDWSSTPSAYEIEVGTDTNWTTSEMWKPGPLTSPATTVQYAGIPLDYGTNYYVRLRASNGVKWSPWSGKAFHTNGPATTPVSRNPVLGAVVSVASVQLTVKNSVDFEQDTVKYDFEVYSDHGLTNLVTSQQLVSQLVSQFASSDTTSSAWINMLLVGRSYWWRARSWDGNLYSEWSAPEMFTTKPATVIHVPGDKATIQEAITAAETGDTVMVAPGSYVGTITFPKRNMVVRSSGGPLATIITHDNYHDLVIFTGGVDSTTVFEGFSLKGGHLAIWCQNSGPTIRHNLIYNQAVRDWASVAFSGAGWASTGSSPVHFINNTVLSGGNGGISNFSSAPPTIANNIVAFNRSYGIATNSNQTVKVAYNNVFSNATNYINIADTGIGTVGVDPGVTTVGGLVEGSPCVDAGDPGPFYNDPDGTRNDLGGAYLACCQAKVRGDVNGSGRIDLADLSYFVFYITSYNVILPCKSAANVNSSGIIDLGDLALLTAYLTQPSGSIVLPACATGPYVGKQPTTTPATVVK